MSGIKYAASDLNELLSWARDEDERKAIHNAYNIGHTEGIKFQQGRCASQHGRNACIFWNGSRPVEDFHEKMKKMGRI